MLGGWAKPPMYQDPSNSPAAPPLWIALILSRPSSGVFHLELDQWSFFVSCYFSLSNTHTLQFTQLYACSCRETCAYAHISYSCQTIHSMPLRSVLYFKATTAQNPFEATQFFSFELEEMVNSLVCLSWDFFYISSSHYNRNPVSGLEILVCVCNPSSSGAGCITPATK